MIQPYSLTPEDVGHIKAAVGEGGKVWSSKHLDNFKQKVKQHYRTAQNEQCSYCKRVTLGEFKMVLDIEHILPKGEDEFKKFTFVPRNLCVSCKRCNMEIKGTDTSFIVEGSSFEDNFYASEKYLFLHPHSDNYWDSIHYSVAIENDIQLIQYTVVNDCPKGLYTYNYFKLGQLEIDIVNEAQGIDTESISPAIQEDLALEIQALFQ
ncbi:TPA: HNH endonuclease [Vibrio parahaemolyticus]